MTDTKALAVAALFLAGVVTRIEIGKAQGKDVADRWWLGHLDAIGELLFPSPEVRAKMKEEQAS